MKRLDLHIAAYPAILLAAALSLGADGCGDGDVPIGADDAGVLDGSPGSDGGGDRCAPEDCPDARPGIACAEGEGAWSCEPSESSGDCQWSLDCPGDYEPCADKTCGDQCTVCAPDDPECSETAVLKYCQPDGTCRATVPECSGGCPEDESSYQPGCGPPGADSRELPSAGCYQPCSGEGDASCAAGTTCQNAWIDPCAGSACLACGGEAWLCLADEGGDDCGGFAGLTCGEDEYCDYPDDTMCGGADQLGTCRPRPEACTEDCPRVCGCDGETYCNSCIAASSGVDVLHDGACDGGGDRDPVSGGCYRSAGHSCDTDADCTTGGCGGETCYAADMGPIESTCDCTMPTDADCGCVDGTCVWYQ